MKTLICGGQNYNDYAELNIILTKLGVSGLVSSQAEGVDSLALIWAKHKGIMYTEHDAGHSPQQLLRAKRRILGEDQIDVAVLFRDGSKETQALEKHIATQIKRVELVVVDQSGLTISYSKKNKWHKEKYRKRT